MVHVTPKEQTASLQNHNHYIGKMMGSRGKETDTVLPGCGGLRLGHRSLPPASAAGANPQHFSNKAS